MTEYKIVWDFKVPSWNKRKKKPVHHKGENTGGIHPWTDKEHVENLVRELNRTYGADTHWLEEMK